MLNERVLLLIIVIRVLCRPLPMKMLGVALAFGKKKTMEPQYLAFGSITARSRKFRSARLGMYHHFMTKSFSTGSIFFFFGKETTQDQRV